MSLDERSLKVCNCNKTMALDAKALAAALKLKQPLQMHTELCRKEVGSFQESLKGEACVVACTQEAPLFSELAREAGAATGLKFINIREHAGWSKEGAQATPKIAALLALADLPEPEAVPVVNYQSGGQLLVIGPAEAAIAWADKLAEQLDVNVLVTRGKGGELPAERRYPVWSGKVKSLKGHLGEFELAWEQDNPIDLEVCTRCNACIHACPEQAIDFSYQIDMDKCKAHRECVKACGAIRAIDFERAERARNERFDMVLDLSAQPVIDTPQLPQGYLAPGADPLEQALAAAQLGQMVGEFEKPRFFAYHSKICAHSRSSKVGCNQCLDVCSTGAITPDGDHVKVDPHLCMGCGGCASVCPSGAMTYAYPRVPDLGARLKRVLSVYAQAGGKDACLLLHNAGESRALLPPRSESTCCSGRWPTAQARCRCSQRRRKPPNTATQSNGRWLMPRRSSTRSATAGRISGSSRPTSTRCWRRRSGRLRPRCRWANPRPTTSRQRSAPRSNSRSTTSRGRRPSRRRRSGSARARLTGRCWSTGRPVRCAWPASEPARSRRSSTGATGRC